MSPRRQPTITHVSVDGLSVEVRRGRVRRMTLRVTEAATVRVSAPSRVPLYEVERFVHAQQSWIAPRLEAARQHVTELERAAQLAEGDSLLVWGHEMPIAYDVRARLSTTRARVVDGTVTIAMPPERANDGPDAVEARQKAVTALWKRELEGRLEEASGQAEALVGQSASSWSVRLMTTRWGSCTPRTRTIRLSSLLARAPYECAVYVAIHEACHLVEPSHNARFHALMDEHCPAWRELKDRLEAPSTTWRP